jgi:AI-2 transport protein TqsA
VVFASIVVIVLGLKAAASILSSVFLALFITMGFSPVIHGMRRRGAPVWLALVSVLVLIALGALVFVGVVAGSLVNLDEKLPVYEQNLSGLVAEVAAQIDRLDLDLSGIETTDVLQPGRIIDIVRGVLGAVFGSLSSVLLMVLIIAFMLGEAGGFSQKIEANMREGGFAQSVAEFSRDIRSYLFIKGWISAAATVPITVLYVVLGTDFALLWGLVFFVFSFIPNIGYVLSVIPPALLTLLELGWQRAVVLIIVHLIINTAVDNGIAPRYMGRGLGLSTLVVFLSLVFWGWVLGPLGALLSVPMTVMVKRLFLERFDETRALALLMAPGPRPLVEVESAEPGP